MAQHGQEHTVDANGRLDAVRNIAFAGLRIEVLNLLSADFLMVTEVEVGTGVDTFELLETEREIEFDIRSSIGVVRQFLVVMETVVLCTHAKVDVPLHAVLLPLGEPFHLGARAAEEFHLHLFELLHAEDELAGHDLVAEGLADLGDAERNLHTAGLLDIQILNEDTLSGLRTQVQDIVGVAGSGTLGAEHQIELADLRPVGGTGNRADDAAVDDDVAVSLEVIGVLGSLVTGVNFVVFRLFAQDIRVGRAELLLVESLAELLAAFGDLFFNLFLDLAEIVFDQVVGTVALLGVFVVDQRIVERSDVAGGNPGLRMHEDAGVDTHDILVQAGHRFPPVALDVVLQFDTHLAIIVHGGQSVIDFAGGEDESVLLAMGDENLEKFFLGHCICMLIFFSGAKLVK